MVDKTQPVKPEQDPFVEEHQLARQILRQRYNDEVRRAAAQHLNVEYAQSQIDYDREHRPENTKDTPRFEKAKAVAEKALVEHEANVGQLRTSLTVLGEKFLDDDVKKEQK